MIQELDHDSVSLHMRADPDTVYALVADVTRVWRYEFAPEGSASFLRGDFPKVRAWREFLGFRPGALASSMDQNEEYW